MAEIDNILDDETVNHVKIVRFENCALFWVKNCNCENPLANFEACGANSSELNVGASVATLTTSDGVEEWNRGIVCRIFHSEVNRYQVFLIDEAKFVRSGNVLALDENYMREPPQANLVALYGVKLESSTDDFLKKIKSLTSENEALYFQRKTLINGISFGHILLYSNNQYRKLQDIIRKECPNAIKSLPEDEFQRIIRTIANDYYTSANSVTKHLVHAKTHGNPPQRDLESVNSKASSSRIMVEIRKVMKDLFFDPSQRGGEFSYFENCCNNDSIISNNDEECKSTFALEVNTCFSDTLVHSNVNSVKERINYVTIQEATEVGVLKDNLARKLFAKELTAHRFPQFSTCQLYALPAIHSGNNLVLISGAVLEVRRYGYLIPLANSLIGFKRRETDDRGNITSPMAIILCPYAADCRVVSRALSDLMDRAMEIVILSDHFASLHKTVGKNIIVVGTPQFFIQAYKTTKRFRFTNTRFLIFDSADILSEKYTKDVDNILNIQAGSVSNCKNIQIIISSQTWIPKLKHIVTRFLKQAIVIIAPSALMEAAIYGGSKFTLLHGIPKKEKVFHLREFLQKHAQKPTAILCSDDEEIDEIKKIDFGSRDCVFVTNDVGKSNRKNVAENYNIMINERKNPILICTDVDLMDIRVKNVQLLINFSVPESITLFSYRFSTLLSNYKSIFSKYHVDTHVFTLLDNDNLFRNDGMLEYIYNWMKRTSSRNSELGDQEIENKLEVLRISKERDLEFCENINQFGKCAEKTCKSRHFLSEKDTPVDYLRRGKIKLRIADTYSATHFAVKILEILENKQWRKVDSIKSYAKVSTFAEDPANLKVASNPKKNDVVIAQVEYHYTRVIILNIVENNAAVKLLDEGGFANVVVDDLYEIPHELKTLPNGVVDLYIFGASPLDNGTTWNPEVTTWVKSQVKNYKLFTSKIFLTLGTKMWSDSIDCKTENGATLFKIPSSIIAQNFATKNTSFWPFLKDLCVKANLQNFILNETAFAPVTEITAHSDKLCETGELKTNDINQSSVANVTCNASSKEKTAESNVSVDASSRTEADSSILRLANTLSNDTGDSLVHPHVSPDSSVLSSVASHDGTSSSDRDTNCETDHSDVEDNRGYLSGDKELDYMLSFLNANRDTVHPEVRYNLTKLIERAREQKIAAQKNEKNAESVKVVKEEIKSEDKLNEGAKVVNSESVKIAEDDEKLTNEPAVDTPISSEHINIWTPKKIRQYFDDFIKRTKDTIPNVRWYQSFEYVFVKIMIENCSEDNSTLFITCTNFTFDAEVDNKRYFLSATPLFGAVVTTDSSVKFNRSYVMIKMKKLIRCDWLRLIRGSQDRPWLSKDLENDCPGIVTPSMGGSRKLRNWKGKEINHDEPWTGHTMDDWVSVVHRRQTSPEGNSSVSESDSDIDGETEDVSPE